MKSSTVRRLGLPAQLRRSLACTNIIENMMGTVRRVTRNVKRWSSSSMALRWTVAAMNEAKKGFRKLKAYKQLPALRVALAAHYEKETNHRALVQNCKGRLTSFTATRASQSSTEHGAIPICADLIWQEVRPKTIKEEPNKRGGGHPEPSRYANKNEPTHPPIELV
jgi:hypothetical protein